MPDFTSYGAPNPLRLLKLANTWTAAQTLNDDIALQLGTGGTVSLIYETADANANALLFVAPEGGATDVPVFVFGDASILNVDLGWFDGITEPSLAIINDAKDAYVRLDAGDDAVAASKGLYFKTAADEDIELINLSVTGTPRFYWDESEDQFRFSKGIVFDAACDVQGTWVATAAWTLPAFTAGGDITLGANKITTTNGYDLVRAGWISVKVCDVEMEDAWSTTVVGSGAYADTTPFEQVILSGATANSSILTRLPVAGFNLATAVRNAVDWDKDLSFLFGLYRSDADAEAVCYIQLKETTTIGILAELGIGLVITNMALSGEAFGTSRGTVDLATTLTANYPYLIEIKLTATGVEFFVNKVSKGTITTAGKFPTGTSGVESDIVCSIANGATGNNTRLGYGLMRMLQEA